MPSYASSRGIDTSLLYLQAGIIMLLFLIRILFGSAFGLDLAFLSCLSLPATYILTYYTVLARRFIEDRHSILKAWLCEASGFLVSFVAGYLAYSAFGGTSLSVYVIAYITAQIMRLFSTMFVIMLRDAGINTERPLVVLAGGFLTALTGLLTIFTLLPLTTP